MTRSETSPFLAPRRSYNSFSDIDESDIVSYVLQRRASMASMARDNVPYTFAAANPVVPQDLTRTRSHASMVTSHTLDVSDILSAHSVRPEPETDVSTEVQALLGYSFPLILTFLLKYSFTVASVFSVGRLGLKELAAVSLSTMTANISGYAIIQGVSTCLDTLCAQAYGRKDYRMVGVHAIRCSYFLLLLFVPMFVLWVFGATPILIAICGHDKAELCQLAGDYLRVLSFGIPGFILFEVATHFLQCQNIFHASTYVLAFCAPLNAFLNYFLVWDKTYGLGFIGAPLSVAITDWVMCFMIFAYIFWVKGYECWPKESVFHAIFFRNWSKMINLSVPGVLMVEAEWLAFEIITFTAASFGTDVLAAQSIVTTTCALMYQIPLAFSVTISTRVAWYIGAASKRAAITATRSSIMCSLTLGLMTGIFLFAFRRPLASLYTNDQSVIDFAAKVLVVASIYQLNEFLSCASGGVLRGQGRQKIGGYMNLFSYYFLALPSAFIFAFYFKLELIGLWLGMIIALVVTSTLQLYFVVTSDWDYIITQSINEAILDENNIS
ncbi:ethionine resistance protein [Suhomyces tanzawaensis NRRL Y-17324]|uniref:Ethionine resistance protein n=1 Tax=Suhomyces tanzawaensis NRRL Y-17324 TaxID=984487 RepID=A0A1E4SMZ9_9ASCO|nr:ethionine resistance protein [Suhomyces tanzawaensis NRRL Y-17324]ODV80762.1 ethionine resistance protein [Suhomyces tanzawaensis NRRL Y-17324]